MTFYEKVFRAWCALCWLAIGLTLASAIVWNPQIKAAVYGYLMGVG